MHKIKSNQKSKDITKKNDNFYQINMKKTEI